MIITPDVLKALMTGFRKNYQDGLQIAKSQYKDIATVVPSSTKSNTYGWLGQWPGFREWVGDRAFNDMAAHSYAIANKHFESSVKVNRDDIEDDNIGIYAPLFTEMGRAAAAFPDQQVFELLKKGHATLCYDGQNFFDTDHPVFAKVDGTGNKTLVKNLFTATGGTQGTPWYLLDTSRALKPLIYQERKAMQFTAMTKGDDEGVFMRNEYRYGADCRSNVGFGFWQMAAMSTEALTPENFAKVYDAMISQKGDGGRPLDIKPTLLLVPTTMGDLANSIIKPDKYENGKYNPHHNKVQVIATPWLL